MFTVKEDQYQTLLAEKQARIAEQFIPFTDTSVMEVYASEPKHYRQRAEFRIWHEDDRCFHAMFHPGTKTDPIEIVDFPIADEAICNLIPKLAAAINATPILKNRLFQIEYLSTLSGDMLVTLIYRYQLGEEWIAAATKLKNELGIHIIGRARKLRIELDQDFVVEELTVDGKKLKYKQIEASFTQPNAKMSQKMLSWTRSCCENSDHDLLELYCGNGNFSLALADQFNRVVATEISKTSVNAANDNKVMNNITNVDFARVSAEEFTEHMNGGKQRQRLAHMDLKNANFGTVLVDPPRAGLDEESCKMISKYERIIYVSCNPDTLELNLRQLSETHTVEKFALFDQFPYTHHVECGAYLVKK